MARGEYLTLPGGHMFPLERPQDTAELLRSLFRRWSAHPPVEAFA
jgi:carboxypeptidase C (cathepsin A)